MHLLYQQQMILKPEDVILSTHEPSVDFLTDMDAILNGPVQVLDSSPKEDPFPPVDTKEAFIFDPDQVHPGLELDPEGCAHSLQDKHRLQTEDIQNTFVAYVSEGKCWMSLMGSLFITNRATAAFRRGPLTYEKSLSKGRACVVHC